MAMHDAWSFPSFLGGAETVTGSKYLVETGSRGTFIDCDFFHGLKQLRLRKRGATIVSGAPSVEIHGAYVPVRAQVKNLGVLSAHAEEILVWLSKLEMPPALACVTHGEPIVSDALPLAIEERLCWPVWGRAHLERIILNYGARA